VQVCHYVQDKNRLKDLFFAIFAVSFFILRGFYYPVFVCMAVAIEHPQNLPEHWWFFGLLWGLYLLYIFWMYLIGKMAYRLLVEKDLGGDVRYRCSTFVSLPSAAKLSPSGHRHQLLVAGPTLKTMAKMTEETRKGVS
jgi:hypothetical protein